jgi:two-component system, sensor histidine kinase
MTTQINTRFVFQLKVALKILMATVFCVGALALIGWQSDVSILKQVLPNLPVIAPNTAVLFVLLGLSLFFVSEKKLAEKLWLFVGLSSFIAILTGLLTLLEYASSFNFGIDNLLFADKMRGTLIRMSPQSALNFITVGASLLLMTRKNKRVIAIGQIIILVTGIISLVSLFGFIYNVSSLYTIYPYKGMAVHTAVAFAMIFAVIFAIHPEIGFMKIFSRKGLGGMAARRLFAALFFLIALEILIMLGQRGGIYDHAYESLIHLFIIAGVFILLIFYVFQSLDKLAEAEKNVAHIKIIDKAKTEFVSLASHQLRTPLTLISWYTEILVNGDAGELNEKQKDCLKEIYIGNQRMIDLVNDILSTSRIDMGTLALEPKLIDLAKIAENVLKEIGPLVKDKEMKINEAYEKNLPRIMADPEMVRMIFQNLLSNSLKYTPRGGQITVEIKKQNSHVLIIISDNGFGIPENQKNRIFTKMFRADNIKVKETSGTGLGLYIVWAIVKKSGGKIWFESKEGKGTTFFVTLPRSASKFKRQLK